MSKPLILGLAGFPIEHSLSPELHHTFAKEAGISIRYQKYSVHQDQLEAFLITFKHQDGLGLNLTMPLKEAVMAFIDKTDPAVTNIQASNALHVKDKKIYAYNTDALAIGSFLEAHDFSITGKQVLICGAGGFAKALAYGLSQQAVKSLWVANRTPMHLEPFKAFSKVNTCIYQEIPELSFDLIINATPSSFQGVVLPLPKGILNSHTTIIDGAYGVKDSPFLNWGKSLGAQQLFDGFGLLVHQAAASFKLWTGIQPNIIDIKHIYKRLICI